MFFALSILLIVSKRTKPATIKTSENQSIIYLIYHKLIGKVVSKRKTAVKGSVLSPPLLSIGYDTLLVGCCQVRASSTRASMFVISPTSMGLPTSSTIRRKRRSMGISSGPRQLCSSSARSSPVISLAFRLVSKAARQLGHHLVHRVPHRWQIRSFVVIWRSPCELRLGWYLSSFFSNSIVWRADQLRQILFSS